MKVWDRAKRKVKALKNFEMVRKDIHYGRYSPSKGTVFAITFALIYFLLPLDAMFDYIPFIGHIDDAAVISFVIERLRGEIKRYMG
ncbi:MAG: YkvA family protein [candidate division WOR-3 bacterium]